MVAVGNPVTIFDDTGDKVDMRPFKPDYQAMEKVLLVDAEVQYTCKYMTHVYVFMFISYLSIPSMGNNPIPLFIMR